MELVGWAESDEEEEVGVRSEERDDKDDKGEGGAGPAKKLSC